MDRVKKILLEHEVVPSIHRMLILQALMNSCSHPSADEIYRALLNQIPTLSKTTVYNTLKTFEEKGIIESFSIMNNEVRYELQPHPHAHFKCKLCGTIYDIYGSFDCLRDKIVEGHKVQEQHINLIGICAACQKKDKNDA
ncbi:MAG: transcriptional repressor [Candidatus Cloacimonetes bacterium]|nr:transcriptional repressor [Candidatus Cloacimonadota bacterium]